MSPKLFPISAVTLSLKAAVSTALHTLGEFSCGTKKLCFKNEVLSFFVCVKRVCGASPGRCAALLRNVVRTRIKTCLCAVVVQVCVSERRQTEKEVRCEPLKAQ